MTMSRCLRRVARIGLALVMGTGLATSADAATILVDFGNDNSFRGVSVVNPDANGHFWNSIVPGLVIPNMIDIANSVTPIDLGFSTPIGTDSFNGPAGPTSFPHPTPAEIAATDIDAAALGNLGVKEAAIDFASSPGGLDNRTRFEIQQLDPTRIYGLTFFGSHKFSDADATVYSVYSDNTYTTVVGTATLNVQQPGSPHLHNRDKVVTIGNLSPQAGNTLFVEFVGTGNNLGYLNALEITERDPSAVAEPSTLVLLASGAAVLFRVRRRRGCSPSGSL